MIARLAWAQKASADQRPGGVDGPSRSELGITPAPGASRSAEDRHRRRAVGQLFGRPWLASRMPSSSATTPASSTSALTRCAGSNAERLIHKLVGFNHRQRQACARIRARVMVVLRRPEGILPRSHSAQKAGASWPALTGCSPPPPALPPSTGCSPKNIHANKVELLPSPSNGRISRFTPTARRMTSAAR